MKRFALLAIALSFAPAAHADLTHKIQSSVQLQVGGAMTTANRLGSTFSISGSGVDTTDGTTANTISTGAVTSGVYAPGTIAATQDTPGAAFSFSQSYTQADALPTAAPTTGAVQNFGSLQSTAAGTLGTLAGTVSPSGAITVVGGGANTLAIGQFVTSLEID
tara:strand:- start:47 stop:535 length:489 start_codon:yes stop_codon:yes gene_type:complete